MNPLAHQSVMPDDDNEFLRRRLDTIQNELREQRLRDEHREAALQSIIRTFTNQLVTMAAEVDAQLSGFGRQLDNISERATVIDDRLTDIEERFGRIETMLADIARKLDA